MMVMVVLIDVLHVQFHEAEEYRLHEPGLLRCAQ